MSINWPKAVNKMPDDFILFENKCYKKHVQSVLFLSHKSLWMIAASESKSQLKIKPHRFENEFEIASLGNLLYIKIAICIW